MRVVTFSVVWNEARMAPWFIRHYSTFADKMIVYCEPSTDGTENILRACPKVELRPWPHIGLDDEMFMWAVNECYQRTPEPDWVAFVDMDELLYHPHIEELLNEDLEVIQAKGLALLSPTGWPQDDGNSQLYHLVRTGVPQENYNKMLLARPRAMMTHTIGRHCEQGVWPHFRGRHACYGSSGLKLFHCHHVGGVEDTRQRNQRCYDRAVNKKYAWNYDEAHNHDPKQVGTVEWVRESLNHLQQVWP